MTDTPPAVQALYRQLLLRRSGQARLKMGCDMFDSARALMRASLAGRLAALSPAELKTILFLRTYGHDLDPEMVDRIVQRWSAPRTGTGESTERPPGAQGAPQRRSRPGA